MLLTNLALSLPAQAAPLSQASSSQDGAPDNSGYSAPVFTHPEPRSVENFSQATVDNSAVPAFSPGALDPERPEDSTEGSTTLQAPPDEPFEILESHPEFAHPWIQNEDFVTDCPLGMEPTERFGICNATWTFYNGSNFTISEYGGYDLRVGYSDSYWRDQSDTYYTSITEICRIGTFNRVEECVHNPVWQREVFKAQDERFPIGPHQRIEMSKTIFWSLDPDVWWIDPRSGEASCTNKNQATDARECPWCNPSQAQGYASDP
ncbi:MAG: hypothetical protein PVF85_14390, partial [Anaerolineales bacterium]